MANVLYRIYSNDGALLYVGASINPALRMSQHARGRQWWDEASEIKLQHFPTPEALAEAEVDAIKTEDPRYNHIHSKPSPWSRKKRRPRGTGTIYRSAEGLWIGRVELPPGPDGKRRCRRVSSRDRATAELKFAELLAEST